MMLKEMCCSLDQDYKSEITSPDFSLPAAERLREIQAGLPLDTSFPCVHPSFVRDEIPRSDGTRRARASAAFRSGFLHRDGFDSAGALARDSGRAFASVLR